MKGNYKFLSILLYSLPVLLNPFPRTFFIEINVNYRRNPRFCPFPVTTFINKEDAVCINEEVVGAIIEAAIGAIIAPTNPPSCFFYFMF